MAAFALAIWTAVVIAIGFLVKFVVETAKPFWLLRKFKGPPARLIMGNFDDDATTNKMVRMFRDWGNRYAPVFKVRIGFLRTFLVTSHPDVVKLLLTRNDPKESWVYDMLEPWLGGSILVTHGKKWQRSRKLLTPAFHLDTLRGYVSIYNECAQQLIDNWSSADGKICEVYGDMKKLTFDILMRCIFSIDTKCLSGKGEDHPYLHAVDELGKLLAYRANSALLALPPVFALVYGRQFNHYCEIVHKYSRETIAERKAQLIKEKDQNLNDESGAEICSRRRKVDFIDVLITSLHEDGSPVNDDEVQPEVDMFMFAGHDTTSSGLTWCLYHLAARQDIQQKCREEVYRVLGSANEVEYSDINSLTYLTQCIKESLRMCPPVPYIGRDLIEPLELPDGRVVPTGAGIFCPITVLHYNETFWPNPEIYDPSRFDPSIANTRPPHAYVPFSSGPRNCIGQIFALNAMKVVLARLIRKFTFAIDVTREVTFLHDIISRPRNGLHLIVRPVEAEL